MSKLKKFKQFLKSPKTERNEKYHDFFIGFIGKGEKNKAKDVKESYYHSYNSGYKEQLNLDLGHKNEYGFAPQYNYKTWHGDNPDFPKYKQPPLPAHPDQQKMDLKGPKKKHATSFDTHEYRANNHHNTDHLELSKHYRLDKDLPHEERFSMKQYSGCEYMNVNKYLYSRGQRTDDYERSALDSKATSGYWGDSVHYAREHFNTVRNHIKNLSLMCKRYKTPKDLVVMSGVSRSPERFINKDKPLDHIRVHMPAFTSTTLIHDVAHGFSKADHEHPHYHMCTSKDEYGNSVYRKISPEDNEKLGHYGEAYRHIMHIHVPKGSHGVYLGDHSDCSHEQEFLLHKNTRVNIDPTPVYNHQAKTVNWHGTLVHDGVRWLKGSKKK